MLCVLPDIPRDKGAVGDSLAMIWESKGNIESTGGQGGSQVGWKQQQKSTKSM